MRLKNHHITFLCLSLVYLFLPSQNANIDSWYYAACVKHNAELWNSHHLLYNGFGRLWYLTLQFFYPNIEAIATLNIMNSIAALACLFVLKACLIKLNTEKQTAFWLTLLCGVSFGFMRFATDAETYILPLLFSLITSYFFVHFKSWKQLILSAFCSCLAILFHQVHIWWGLVFVVFLLIQKPFSIKNILLFVSFLLLVPVVYFIVFKYANTHTTFIQFVTGEYSKGNASLEFNLKNLLFTAINFMRSFIQIHGNIFDFIPSDSLLARFLLLLMLVLYYLIFKLKPWQTVRKIENNHYKLLFVLAFVLHLIFAFLSSANAEFMVMLPFLLVLYLGCSIQFIDLRFLKTLVLVIFIWNMCFGILPQYFLSLNKVNTQVDIAVKNPKAYFLWQNKPLVENIITYQKGFNIHHQYIDSRNEKFYLQVDSLLSNNHIIFIDKVSKSSISRNDFYSKQNELNLRNYELKVFASYKSFYGENEIFLITKKHDFK